MIPDVFYGSEFWLFFTVGFVAQMVDGALGMAYGTLSTSILLSAGIAPRIVSASVHTAQFFTTGLSAISHSYFKNLNKKLLLSLAIAGAAGGFLGAMLLTHIDGSLIKPWVACYLMFLGFLILWKRLRKKRIVNPDKAAARKPETIFRSALGFVGGFLDALGGGWGPMVTSSLIARDEDPRLVIGSVNIAEFFVKTTIAVTLMSTMDVTFGSVLLGLLAGGVLAAPFGAYMLRFIQPEILMDAVGVLIIGLSGFTLYKVFA